MGERKNQQAPGEVAAMAGKKLQTITKPKAATNPGVATKSEAIIKPEAATGSKAVTNIITDEGFFQAVLNPDVYSLDVVFSAAYVLIGRAYIFVDKDEKGNLLVNIKPRAGQDSARLADDFNSQLINYSVYRSQLKETSELRLKLLSKALFGAAGMHPGQKDADARKGSDGRNQAPKKAADDIEDEEGILVPWEDKFSD